MAYKRHNNYKDQIAVYKQQLATAIGICDISILLIKLKAWRLILKIFANRERQ